MPTDGFLLASNGDHRGKRAHRKPQLYPVTRKKGGASQGNPSETPYGKPGGPRRSGERSALAERTFGILGKIVCRLRMFLQEGRRRDKAVCCGDITSRRDIVQIGNAQQGLNVHVMRLGQHGVPEEDQGVDPAFRDTGPHLLIPPERTGFQALHGGRRALVAKQLAQRRVYKTSRGPRAGQAMAFQFVDMLPRPPARYS